MTDGRPLLLVIAGPNGSGKSTLTQSMMASHLDMPIVNPDIYSLGLTHISDGTERNLEAARQCEAIRERLLAQGKSFAFETVGSTEGKVDFVARAASSGYRIVLLFVTTSNPTINVRRIADRVRRGGHDVPEDKVFSRYRKAMSLLHIYLALADEASVYDNSDDSPVLAVSKAEGNVVISPGFEDRDWVVEYILPWLRRFSCCPDLLTNVSEDIDGSRSIGHWVFDDPI